jgi:hypothetical protein
LVQTRSNPAPVLAETGFDAAEKPVCGSVDNPADPEAFTARGHARRLLAALQDSGYVGLIASADVRDRAYSDLCARLGWQRRPWHSRDGVGKHLAQLCGGRPVRPDENGKPVRCYAVPAKVVRLDAARRA